MILPALFSTKDCLGVFFVCFFLFRVFCVSISNFKIAFCSSVKNVVKVFMEIALNLQITFGNGAIFTILILPIHDHGRSFHCLISSTICSSVSQYLYCRGLSLPSLGLFLGFVVLFSETIFFLSQHILPIPIPTKIQSTHKMYAISHSQGDS